MTKPESLKNDDIVASSEAGAVAPGSTLNAAAASPSSPNQQMSRANEPFLAYLGPMIAFMIFGAIETKGWFGLDYTVWYTLKLVIVTCIMFSCRRSYPDSGRSGLLLGIVGGVVGIVVWLGLDWAQEQVPILNVWIQSYLGGRASYQPFAESVPQFKEMLFVVVRLIGLILVVPFMEEYFWRGFLARYLLSEQFSKVAIGTMTSRSFFVVTLAFSLIHPELLAAFVWGAMINLLYMRTRNLGACIAMHMVTNALLGAYVLKTGEWRLW